MSKAMDRRRFLKCTAGGLTALVVGDMIPGLMENEAFSQVRPGVQTINFRITDGLKEMVTHNSINPALCYFWLYKATVTTTGGQTVDIPAEVPGPNIFTTFGEFIQINVTNNLDEPHSFTIPGVPPRPGLPARAIVDTGPIAPGATVSRRFRAPNPGTYLYFDNLNAPVNRVMGLHGALVVMPRIPATLPGRPLRNKVTPYARATPAVQRLFNDLGGSAHYPGLGWGEGDPANDTPAFRQYIWLLHQASPILFEEVGRLGPGVIMPPQTFVEGFLRDPFNPTGASRKAQYFTIAGQSGHFSHNNSFICPNLRVGEPALIRTLNAGLWTHSMHIHANHVYVIARNGIVQTNPIWVDTFDANPLDTYDWLVPANRPVDIPNERGIGLPDPGLPVQNPVLGTAGRTWPPEGEIQLAFGQFQPVELSPICYPMHDHSEPSQTSQGGNYNLGLISGLNFTGDRTQGAVRNFPRRPTIHGPNATGPAAGPEEA